MACCSWAVLIAPSGCRVGRAQGDHNAGTAALYELAARCKRFKRALSSLSRGATTPPDPSK
eukprot:13614151-Alexandrium_andersonii.AAC.1